MITEFWKTGLSDVTQYEELECAVCLVQPLINESRVVSHSILKGMFIKFV